MRAVETLSEPARQWSQNDLCVRLCRIQSTSTNAEIQSWLMEVQLRFTTIIPSKLKSGGQVVMAT